MKKLLYLACAGLLSAGWLSSCNADDDFTESIFDTTTPAVDTTLATREFDAWLYNNFVKPYNTAIYYRFNFLASDMDYHLAPADYDKSQLLARLIRYLFYDVYTKQAGDEFMRQYGPRMFHFIGSPGINPVSGTEILGLASGGIKITLYNVNEMSTKSVWDESDLFVLNQDYFHTMHHEFSHILHQTKPYPVTFGHVTPSTYEPLKWNERDSVTTHTLGYVTHYASSATYEDFVETLSCIITDQDSRWMLRIIDGCLNGVKDGDKQSISDLIDSLRIDVNSSSLWNNFKLYREVNIKDIDGKKDTTFVRFVPSFYASNSAAFEAAEGNTLSKVNPIEFESFDEYMKWVPVTTVDTIAGMNSILKKIEIASKWYQNKWNMNIYEVRREVDERQKNINEFMKTVEYFGIKKDEE